MKHWLLVFSMLCLGLLLAFVSLARAQRSTVTPTPPTPSSEVPRMVKFSGTVKDSAGHPRSGVIGITFALYKDEQDGAPLWLETQNVQADSKGNYAVLLGSATTEGLPTDIFTSNDARWLGVQVEGQDQQSRTLLVSAPYALKAVDAETLGGKPISAFQLAAPQSQNATTSPSTAAAAEQPNEITCSSGTACKSAFVPLFSSNGGSAKVSDSIISQIGSTVDVGGSVNVGSGVTGQTGFFRSSNSGSIFQATNTGAGGALAGVAEGNNGTGVFGSGVTGVSGFGLSNGTGVFGQGGAGVFGQGGTGVVGEAKITSGQTFGVQGFNSNNTDFSSGVSGVADGGQNKTFGVEGVSLSPNGTGLWGLGQGQSQIGQHIGCCGPVGVWGDTSSNAGGAAGLVGTADDGFALVVENNSTTHLTANIQNDTTTPSTAILTVNAPGTGQFCNINTNGVLFCSGGHSVAVPVDNGRRQVAVHAVESPQNWFEDFGSGRLERGVGTIALEPTFAQTVNTGSGYHVFLTPKGECRGLYVSNESGSGFEVHELGGGRSNVAFDYRVVALRRGYENVRLEDQTEMVAKTKDSAGLQVAKPDRRWRPQVSPKPFRASALSATQAGMVPTKSTPVSPSH